jgi:hypothetical protein
MNFVKLLEWGNIGTFKISGLNERGLSSCRARPRWVLHPWVPAVLLWV